MQPEKNVRNVVTFWHLSHFSSLCSDGTLHNKMKYGTLLLSHASSGYFYYCSFFLCLHSVLQLLVQPLPGHSHITVIIYVAVAIHKLYASLDLLEQLLCSVCVIHANGHKLLRFLCHQVTDTGPCCQHLIIQRVGCLYMHPKSWLGTKQKKNRTTEEKKDTDTWLMLWNSSFLTR